MSAVNTASLLAVLAIILFFLYHALRSQQKKKLIRLLKEAESLLRQGQWDTTWAGYDSQHDFANELHGYHIKLAKNDFSCLPEIQVLFLPTGAWDDIKWVDGKKPPAGIADQILFAAKNLRPSNRRSKAD